MQHLLNQVRCWPLHSNACATLQSLIIDVKPLEHEPVVLCFREKYSQYLRVQVCDSQGLGEGGPILLLPSPHAAVLGSHAQTAVGREPARFLPTAQICLHLLYRSAPAPRLPRRLHARRSDAQWIHQRHRYGWRLFTIKHNLCIMRLS